MRPDHDSRSLPYLRIVLATTALAPFGVLGQTGFAAEASKERTPLAQPGCEVCIVGTPTVQWNGSSGSFHVDRVENPEFNGQQAGTFGLMGSYSSFFSHHMSTMEGGMVVTDDEELYHILLSLRSHGWTRHLPKHNRVCGTKGDDPFEESFRFVLPGYNLRPLELSGAIGCKQVKKLPGFMRIRRENAERFRELMQSFPQFRIQKETGNSSWFGFSLVIQDDAGFSRKQLVESLTRHGIECRPIVAGNFAKNEVVSLFDHSIHGELRAANDIDRNGLFIGNHHYRLDKELSALRAALSDVGEKAALRQSSSPVVLARAFPRKPTSSQSR